MNLTQRRQHLISWLLLAVLLSLGFVAAIVAIPHRISQKEIFREKPEALPKIISWQSSDNYIAALRTDPHEQVYQLEVIVTKPFQNPDVLIYLFVSKGKEPSKQILLGKLNGKGTIRLPVPRQALQESRGTFGFFDPYGKVLLSKIQFEL